MLERTYKFFTSVRLAVVLLALGLILVFWGTIAQVKLRIAYPGAGNSSSLFIYWKPAGSSWRIPIFPGGYLVGGLLLINLLAAHLRYYRPGLKRLGIAMIHLGVVMLLLGQFATDMLSTESYMKIREGSSANFSESNSRWELAVIDTSDAQTDKVVAIPRTCWRKAAKLRIPNCPSGYGSRRGRHPNSALTTSTTEGFEPVRPKMPQACRFSGAACRWSRK